MRPGYLGDLSDCWFGQVEDESVMPGEALRYLDPISHGLPPDREIGYVPEYMRYSKLFPYYHPNIMPRPLVPLRDPRTFNTLMI